MVLPVILFLLLSCPNDTIGSSKVKEKRSSVARFLFNFFIF